LCDQYSFSISHSRFCPEAVKCECSSSLRCACVHWSKYAKFHTVKICTSSVIHAQEWITKLHSHWLLLFLFNLVRRLPSQFLLMLSSDIRMHSSLIKSQMLLLSRFRGVTVDEVWIGYWNYWHHLELQVVNSAIADLHTLHLVILIVIHQRQNP
jgi:hypothetical protein